MKAVVIAKSAYFHEYRDNLLANLKEFGIEAEHYETLPHSNSGVDLALVVGIHEHMSLPIIRNYLLVGFQTEQLPCFSSCDRRLMRNMRRFSALKHGYDHIFEWSPSIYASSVHGSKVSFLPYGCSPQPFSNEEKEFDLFFTGNLPGTNGRRSKIIDKLKEKYRFFPSHYVSGNEKKDAIRRSSICLNIHYYEHGGFESPRIFDYLSNNAFVISEESDNSFPFVKGKDFIEFKNENDLFEKIDHYFNSPQEMQLIRQEGHRTAQRYSFDNVFEQMSLDFERLQNNRVPLIRSLHLRSLAAIRSDLFVISDKLSIAKRRLISSS